MIYIGTSGWHYDDWRGTFYPPEITGYQELRFFAQHFSTVENNSSFYRIAGESTYKTWSRMTPDDFRFSMKLNRLVTHVHRLEILDEVVERVRYILSTTEVLGPKLGAMVIQLPASLRYDLKVLGRFLDFFMAEARHRRYPLDVAIEFRNAYWLNEKVYALLRRHNVALVAAQSSRYPGARETTADFHYIRMHGPAKLFASKYSTAELKDWADYIRKISKKSRHVYVYFNNDFYGYALQNAKTLQRLVPRAAD